MSTNRLIKKQIGVCPCKSEYSAIKSNNMDKFQNNYTEGKEQNEDKETKKVKKSLHTALFHLYNI